MDLPERALRRLTEMSVFGTWISEFPSGKVRFDARWARAMGYSDGSCGFEVASWDELVHPEDRAALAAARLPLGESPAGGCTCEYRMLRADGESTWVRELSTVLDSGPPPRLLLAGTHADIDRQKLSDQRLDVQRRLGSTIAACTEYREALSGAARILSALPPFDDALVLLPAEETGELLPMTGDTARGDILEDLSGYEPETSPVCRCSGGSPVYFSPLAARTGTAPASACALPVEFGGRMIALLLFTSASAGSVPAASQEILGSVSVWIGRALSMILNMNRLEEMVRIAREDAEARSELLREVNHRVKNNLAAIIGLLYAEERFPSPSGTEIRAPGRQDLIRRIEGLAVVHSMLSAVRWAPVPLTDLVRSLVEAVLKVLPPGRTCTVAVSRSSLVLRSDQAHHFGMLVNELASNTLKHAVPYREAVHIAMEIGIEGDLVRMTYRDDGPGFPPEVLRLERHNLGFELVRNIVRSSLGGEIVFRNEDGAVVDITFQRRRLE